MTKSKGDVSVSRSSSSPVEREILEMPSDDPVPLSEALLLRKAHFSRPSPLVELINTAGGPSQSFFRAISIALVNKLQRCERQSDGFPTDETYLMMEDTMMLGLLDITMETLQMNEYRYKNMLMDESKAQNIPWYLIGLEDVAVVANNWVERIKMLKNERFTPTFVEMDAVSFVLQRPLLVVQNPNKPHLFNSHLCRENIAPLIIRFKPDCIETSGKFYAARQAQREKDMNGVDHEKVKGFLKGIDMMPDDVVSTCNVNNIRQTYRLPDPRYLKERRDAEKAVKADQERRKRELEELEEPEEEQVVL